MSKTDLPDGWIRTTIGDVFKPLRTSSHSRSQISKNSSNAFYIHYGDIHRTDRFYLDFGSDAVCRLQDGLSTSNFDPLETGDLIIADASEDYEGTASCFEVRNLEGHAISGLHTIALRPNKEKVAEGFSCLLLKNPVTREHLLKIAAGVSVLGISKGNTLKAPIYLPPLPEQKMIADTLQTWDTAIEKTEALITAKEKQFDTLTRNHISVRQSSSSWQPNTIGDIFDIKTYSSKSSLIKDEGDYYIVDMGSISRNGNLIKTKKTNVLIDPLNENDLVMPKDDIGGGNIIGKVAIIEKLRGIFLKVTS